MSRIELILLDQPLSWYFTTTQRETPVALDTQILRLQVSQDGSLLTPKDYRASHGRFIYENESESSDFAPCMDSNWLCLSKELEFSVDEQSAQVSVKFLKCSEDPNFEGDSCLDKPEIDDWLSSLTLSLYFKYQKLDNFRPAAFSRTVSISKTEALRVQYQPESIQTLSQSLIPSLSLDSPEQFTTASYELVTPRESDTLITISASAFEANHFVTYYTWSDLLVVLTVIGLLLHMVLSVTVVPTKEFLVDYLIRETSVVQRASHLQPKWHILNDSVQEMVTVGRDTMHHRQKLQDSSFWGFNYCSQTGCTWLCCRQAVASPGFWCCCLFKRKRKMAPCASLDVVLRARNQLEKELDIVRLVKRLRQTEGLLYAMTTKGQRRLARWQARHVLKLGFEDEPDHDGENQHADLDESEEEFGDERIPKRKMLRRFNQFESTDSDLDYKDDIFSGKLVSLISKDFSRLNLQLLKGVIMKPEVKQLARESQHFQDEPEQIPIALEEIMLREKIRLEQEMEAMKAKMEEKRRIRELEAQIMVNAMVPEKSTVMSQTEEPARLISQSRVLSLEIEPPEVVLPTIKPPTVYMQEDQKKRFVSRLLTDPDKTARVKHPLAQGLTFKEQLAKEKADEEARTQQQARWKEFEEDLKRREQRANQVQKEAQKVIQEEKLRKQREEVQARKEAEKAKRKSEMSKQWSSEADKQGQSRMDNKVADPQLEAFVSESEQGTRAFQNSTLSEITNDQSIRPFNYQQTNVQMQPGSNRALHFISAVTAAHDASIKNGQPQMLRTLQNFNHSEMPHGISNAYPSNMSAATRRDFSPHAASDYHQKPLSSTALQLMSPRSSVHQRSPQQVQTSPTQNPQINHLTQQSMEQQYQGMPQFAEVDGAEYGARRDGTPSFQGIKPQYPRVQQSPEGPQTRYPQTSASSQQVVNRQKTRQIGEQTVTIIKQPTSSRFEPNDSDMDESNNALLHDLFNN